VKRNKGVKKMSTVARIERMMDEAKRTNYFVHNPRVAKLYRQFNNAVEARDKETAKTLLNKMGF